MNGKPPAPLEWHPYYRDRAWLMDWLEGRLYDPHHVSVPVTSRLAWFTDDVDPTAPDLRELILTKSKAVGPAPYVGGPFVYVWPVGTDQYGRHIAGEARIQYTDEPPRGLLPGVEAVMDDLTVQKRRHILPVSTDLLMDMGVIPDTRPPVVYPLRTRIRWAIQRRVRRVRLHLGEWVAGERFDEDAWW